VALSVPLHILEACTACALQIPKIAIFFLGIRPLQFAWSAMTQIRSPTASLSMCVVYIYKTHCFRVFVRFVVDSIVDKYL
jgi:hypothetical protein